MKGRIFAGLFLCSLFFVVGGDAKSPDTREKPLSCRVRALVGFYHALKSGGMATPDGLE